jgi:hypothetical protein
MFSYISLEERVPAAHPLRKLRGVVDALLATMDREFEAVYARRGRPSVPPEMLLKVTPHVAAKDKHSAVDGRIRRHEGYQTWQQPWLVGRASCVSAGIGAPERGEMASKRAWETAEIAAQLLLSSPKRRHRGMQRV